MHILRIIYDSSKNRLFKKKKEKKLKLILNNFVNTNNFFFWKKPIFGIDIWACEFNDCGGQGRTPMMFNETLKD
jgi:hypothetical protein